MHRFILAAIILSTSSAYAQCDTTLTPSQQLDQQELQRQQDENQQILNDQLYQMQQQLNTIQSEQDD